LSAARQPNWGLVVTRDFFVIDAGMWSPDLSIGAAWYGSKVGEYKLDLTEEAEYRYNKKIQRSLQFQGGVTLYQPIPGAAMKSKELKPGLKLVTAGDWIVAPGSRRILNQFMTFESGMEGGLHSFREPEPFLVDFLKAPKTAVRA
jgi:hypothetical protein